MNFIAHPRTNQLPEGAVEIPQSDWYDFLTQIGMPNLDENYHSLTGVRVLVDEDGSDYAGVWLCERSRPFDIITPWNALPWYFEPVYNVKPENLPIYWRKDNPAYALE